MSSFYSRTKGHKSARAPDVFCYTLSNTILLFPGTSFVMNLLGNMF